MPEESPHTLGTYAKIIFNDWGAKMSGIVFAIIIPLSVFLFAIPVTLAVLAFGIIALFVVCYRTWKTEREDRDSLVIQLAQARNELADQSPRLLAVIEEMGTDETKDEIPLRTAVTLKIIVTNLGSPSVAVNWQPVIIPSGREPLTFSYVHSLKELTLGTRNGKTISVKPKEMIYEKTAIPIERGGRAVGYLHFVTDLDAATVRSDDTVVKVVFEDVTGRRCEAILDKRTSFPLTGPRYTPGLKMRMKADGIKLTDDLPRDKP